ncbi:MAG: SDR family NAD(P)-dependent oxidoreductase [Deltaproteobacteria bacterium]|nr:SDR family NAD(P)-dependent oxidoreductase [Deltaproteobacteria bacterium]MCB9478218.1 SDR family NAD(P)-dependent oxidoreductase [Deltaproteobacteria bacterium]
MTPESFLNFRSAICGKRILITGGTGTVGQALIRALLPLDPMVIRVYSRDEQKQYYMRDEYRDERRMRFFIGDVRDYGRLRRAMEDVDMVFHLAGLKHVESCEYNPFEAIKTNINGTQNVIDAALAEGVGSVVFASSDKAVNPSNAMGASKLMAEKLMVAADYSKGSKSTRFASVRFGNVLGSSGSVIPTFVKRIRAGKDLPITHPDMTRFVISFRECIELLLTAATESVGGEIFIRKMPVVRIPDLAEALIQLYAGKNAPVETKVVGVRAGEKLYEELVTEEESTRTVDTGRYLIILPTDEADRADEPLFPGATPLPVGAYTSRLEAAISVPQIKRLLTEAQDPIASAGDEGEFDTGVRLDDETSPEMIDYSHRFDSAGAAAK